MSLAQGVKVSDPQRALTAQDTLLKYNKSKRIVAGKKVIKSQYSHVIGVPPVPGKSRQTVTEEVLDVIFPPRFYKVGGKEYKQVISREPAYHWDVKELEQSLDDRLKDHVAGEFSVGLCTFHQKMFEQCFDEILRQVTINMCERGMLLKRIKDEMKKTLTNYHKLYLSATKYTIRKALLIASNQFEMEKTIMKLTEQKDTQELHIEELLAEEEREVREEREMRELSEKEHTTECFLLRKKCRVLESQIRTKVVARALKKKAKRKQLVKKYKNRIFKVN